MGRPKHPLISKRKTLEVALRIIDEDGLEALSIRELGKALNVRGISLYHHFKSKEQILVGACELALAHVRTPPAGMAEWRDWLTHNTVEYWKALRAHPNLIPILMRRHPLRIGLAEHNATAGLLAVQGVPPTAIMPLLEAVEALPLGCAAYESAVEADDHTDDWEGDYPYLFHVWRNRALTREQVFRSMIGAVIDAVLAEHAAVTGQGQSAPVAPPAPAKAAPKAEPEKKRPKAGKTSAV